MVDPVQISPEILDEIDSPFTEHQFLEVGRLHMGSRNVLGINPQEEGGQFSEYRLTESSANFLHQWAQVPVNFIKMIDDDSLALTNWNYFLNRLNSRGDVRALKAVIHEDQVVGWTRRGWQELRPSEVIRACASALGSETFFERAPTVRDCVVQFHLTAPNLQYNFEENAGFNRGLHHFSIFYDFDALGRKIPEVRIAGHRQVCANITYAYCGVDGQKFRIFERGRDEMLQKFTELTGKSIEFLNLTFVPQIQKTLETQLLDFSNDIQDFFRAHRIPELVQNIVLDAAAVENLGGTMYHLTNSLTRAANSERCPPEWRNRLQRLAGHATLTHTPESVADRCPSCHRSIPH